jgi:hypothetical protein
MTDRSPDPISLEGGPLAATALGAHSSRQVAELRRGFEALKKATKTIAFNRHRKDAFLDYIQPAFDIFDSVSATGPLELKLEVSTVVWGNDTVLEDDGAENNIVYPLWRDGVRLLVFMPGLKVEEFLRFYAILIDVDPGGRSEDLLTRLWKQEFTHIDWVVMTDYDLVEGEEVEEVEVEVERVLQYLHHEMQSEQGESISFARVSLDDLNLKLEDLSAIRKTKIEGEVVDEVEQEILQHVLHADEQLLLDKIMGIIFQVMELPATPSEVDDISAAIEQLLDGLILEGKFGTIGRVIEKLDAFAYRSDLPLENRELARSCQERLMTLMMEGQRVAAVGSALNSGVTKDLAGVKDYLVRLGPTATVQLLNLLDSLTVPNHRRVVADALVEVGRHGVALFAKRLETASSNLAKELLYIIDSIDPPNKLELFRGVLKHENAVLRMEGLTAIGRNTNDDKCFHIIREVFEAHEVPQMRAHAARILATMPRPEAAKALLDAAREEHFDDRPDGEKRAIFGAVARIEGSDDASGFVRGVFEEKGGLLHKRKVAERKLMMIGALSTAPSIPNMQLLAEVLQAPKNHSKEVLETAHKAALSMRQRLLGGGGP